MLGASNYPQNALLIVSGLNSVVIAAVSIIERSVMQTGLGCDVAND